MFPLVGKQIILRLKLVYEQANGAEKVVSLTIINNYEASWGMSLKITQANGSCEESTSRIKLDDS